MKAMNCTPSRFTPGSRSPVRLATTGAMLVIILLTATPAQAAFHLWTIREVYSDATGTNQFIEFFTTSGSQQFVAGQSITVTPTGGGSPQSVTMPLTLTPGDSANRAFIVGTVGITNFGAPKPDHIIPSNFLPIAGGTISYFGLGDGPYTALPTDGVLSRTWVGGGNAVNSPQNYAGQTGTISIPNLNSPPAITITSPLNGAIFGTPDLVNVGVSAIDTNGTIASVQLLLNGTATATNTVSPFGFLLNNLPVGNHTLRAIAQDNGALKATSAPVSIQVVSGPRLVFAPGTNGPVRFQFQSSNGVSYVIERALPLTNFTPVVTNPGNGGTLQYSETNGGPGQGTYRVRAQ
jgi:hypothetical protein